MSAAFGGRLRAALGLAGWTQADLGDAVGVSQAAVSKWIRGVAWPEAPLLARTAESLGVPIDFLISSDEPVDEATFAASRRLRATMRRIGVVEAEHRVTAVEPTARPRAPKRDARRLRRA